MDESKFWRAVELIDAGDVAALDALLVEHPELATQRALNTRPYLTGYFTAPTLLHFVAENPVRTGTLPANVADVVRTLLRRGAEVDAPCGENRDVTVLGLVASGRVAREQGRAEALIAVLVEAGADANAVLHGAVAHREVESVFALLRQGARIDLVVAAAFGWLGEMEARATNDAALLAKALAAAAIHGRPAAVTWALAHGARVNQFNPPGFHQHSTPLHQAVASGSLETVQALVDGGADRSLKDTIHSGDALGWARHGGATAIVDYLAALPSV